MTLIKENKGVRKEIPNRMMSATFTLPIDGRNVIGILNYVVSDTGITPMAFWVKLKPTDSYLDRELRASGKLISRCCLLYTSPSPRDRTRSRMPSSA